MGMPYIGGYTGFICPGYRHVARVTKDVLNSGMDGNVRRKVLRSEQFRRSKYRRSHSDSNSNKVYNSFHEDERLMDNQLKY